MRFSLSHHQYCVVVNPLGDDGRPHLGCRELRKGPKTFFLHPGNYNYLYIYMSIPIIGIYFLHIFLTKYTCN